MQNDAEGEIADMLSMCNKYPNFEDDDMERYVIENSHDVVTVFDGSPAVIVFDELVKADGDFPQIFSRFKNFDIFSVSKYLPFKMEQSYEKADEIAAKMATEEIHVKNFQSSNLDKLLSNFSSQFI